MSATRILVAEDEAISRMDLREMLENIGYSVVGEAGDGVAAVNLARALKPDLVLMDVKMPELDGISAAQTLSSERVAPVLLLTLDEPNPEQKGPAPKSESATVAFMVPRSELTSSATGEDVTSVRVEVAEVARGVAYFVAPAHLLAAVVPVPR